MELKVFFVLTIAAVAQCKLLPLSCEQIRQFVDGHNSRRLLLARGKISGQPAASEMKKMVWDEELAAKASDWARKNMNGHNPDKTLGSGRFQTGENLYWYKTTDMNYKLQPNAALKSWWNEYVHFNFGPLTPSQFAQENDIGHYTQMAWADTVYVGCAVDQTVRNDQQYPNQFFVVCNYGPAGNYLGQNPYKTGKRSNKLTCGGNTCNNPYGPKCKKVS